MSFTPLDIIVGCEKSQAVTIELRKIGHNAYSCDLQECTGGHTEWHLKMDLFDAVKLKKWDAGIFFPDCTYLTVTANRWLKDQPARRSGALVGEARRVARLDAIAFVKRIWALDIKSIAIENPVGCLSTEFMQPSQIVCPTMFGHKEPKKTCLWLKNVPRLIATENITPEYHLTKSGKRVPRWFFYADKTNGQHGRAEIRSKTFEGIASAMANQWFGAVQHGGILPMKNELLLF